MPRIRHRATPEVRLRWNLAKYGLTPDDYLRMWMEQDGKCAICCRAVEQDGYGQSTDRLCVDHCHATGRVRGLLCHACNKSLGNFEDNIAFLEAAIAYLKRFQP